MRFQDVRSSENIAMPNPAPAFVQDRPAAKTAAQTTALSLEAQRELMPQALGLFGVSLPIFVWVGSFATDASFMAASFAVFAINWGAFYVIVNWLRRPEAADLGRRQRVQVLGRPCCGPALWPRSRPSATGAGGQPGSRY